MKWIQIIHVRLLGRKILILFILHIHLIMVNIILYL
nr:MAG TPA: hypothetical protein [Caudoviricetes sp.]